jgi:hypothetical protein
VGHARDHPLIAVHATRRRPALRFSEVVKPGVLIRDELYGDLLHAADVDYEIAIDVRSGRGKTVVARLGRTERGFSERDRDVLDIARPGLERALQAPQARAPHPCARRRSAARHGGPAARPRYAPCTPARPPTPTPLD